MISLCIEWYLPLIDWLIIWLIDWVVYWMVFNYYSWSTVCFLCYISRRIFMLITFFQIYLLNDIYPCTPWLPVFYAALVAAPQTQTSLINQKQIEDFVGEWLTAFPHNAPTKFKIATDPIRSHPVSSSSLNYLWSSSRVFCLLNFFLIKIQYSFFNFTLKTVHWGIFLSRYLNKK